MLPLPHDGNISCSLLALQGYRNKTAGYAAGEIFISLHGGFLTHSKMSCKPLISNQDIYKNNLQGFFAYWFGEPKIKTSERKVT